MEEPSRPSRVRILESPSSPFLRSSEIEGEGLPQDDLCLLWNQFDGARSPSIQYEDNETDKDEHIHEGEDDVLNMPPFPTHQGAEETLSQDDLQHCILTHTGSPIIKQGMSGMDSVCSMASTSSLATLPVPKSPRKSAEVTTKRRVRAGKRRKNAEERAAQIRARNRRAQQAFRKRQKVLSAERNVSLAKLEDDVSALRDTNSRLQQRVQELQAELESERRNDTEAASQLSLMPHLAQPFSSSIYENDNPDVLLPSNLIL